MMAFYIKPPYGFTLIVKLNDFVLKRLRFLYQIHRFSVEDLSNIIEKELLTKNSDCLIEGTVKDKISHFVLRILCSSDAILKDFFIESEVKLFDFRLKFCDFSKMRLLLRKAKRQSEYILQTNGYVLKSYREILMIVIEVANQVENAFNRSTNYIKVPFTSALNFVKNRIHPLHLGKISLPLKDFKFFLSEIFKETVVQGMNQIRTSLCIKELDDPQMSLILENIQKWFLSQISIPKFLSVKKYPVELNVTQIAKFPLCMQNLHNQLLSHHRLKHLSRIQYILFLKDIGVPCSDVINLFMKEYSIPLVPCETKQSLCSHNWAESGKKYIYSIEHLYGMHGSRKNYGAHSCRSLQNNYDSIGGCPFATFDRQHLGESLKCQDFQVEDIEDVLSFSKEKKYEEACTAYMLHKANVYTRKNSPDCHIKRKYCSSDLISLTLNNNYQIFNDSNIISESCENSSPNSNNPLIIKHPSDFFSILSHYVKDICI